MVEGLSNQTQAVLMLFVFLLPPVVTWLAMGFPTDRVTLGILGAAVLSGILAFIKELLGGKPQTPKVQ